MMNKRKRSQNSKAADPRPAKKGTPQGIILERFKRLHGLPQHPLDWQSEFFMTHFLSAKKRAAL